MASGHKLTYQQPLLVEGWERFDGDLGDPVPCDGRKTCLPRRAGFFHRGKNVWYCPDCASVLIPEIYDELIAPVARRRAWEAERKQRQRAGTEGE